MEMERSVSGKADESKLILVFATIHEVIGCEKALKAASLWCDLIPTPRQLSSDCGMVVVVRESELPNALNAAAAKGVSPEETYRQVGKSFEKV